VTGDSLKARAEVVYRPRERWARVR
jgi:hypothetical protein